MTIHNRTIISIKQLILAVLFITCAMSTKAQTFEDSDSCYIEPRHWYIKTNTIGWALGITNASFEFEVAKHLSFTIPMYYSGWNFPKHTAKLRILAYQPELRYWWRHEGGWFAGIHGGVAFWNYATDGAYRRQDHHGHRPAYGAGLSVGYRTMPINKRLKFEFSLGGGYYHFYYDKYINVKGGELVNTRHRNLFIIDNATVSLVYSFNMYGKLRCHKK